MESSSDVRKVSQLMGSGFNLPPGCYESDLPGYNDVDGEVEFECETDDCEIVTFSEDCTWDSRDNDVTVSAICPGCNVEVTSVVNSSPYEPDYD
jgi:hypothetical protein